MYSVWISELSIHLGMPKFPEVESGERSLDLSDDSISAN